VLRLSAYTSLSIVVQCNTIDALTQSFSSPVTGYLADNYGRRPFLLFSLFGSAVGLIAQAQSYSIWTFVAARAFTGLFSGSVPLAAAYIGANINGDLRPRCLAILGSVIGFSFLIGPGIGSGLAEFSLKAPMYVAAIAALGGFTLAFFKFHEPGDAERLRERRACKRTEKLEAKKMKKDDDEERLVAKESGRINKAVVDADAVDVTLVANADADAAVARNKRALFACLFGVSFFYS
jgi:MFS family permease